jgi:hypothetical protein
VLAPKNKRMEEKRLKLLQILSTFDLEEYKDTFFSIGVDTEGRLRQIDQEIYKDLTSVIVIRAHRNSLNKMIKQYTSFVPVTSAEPISSKKRLREEPAHTTQSHESPALIELSSDEDEEVNHENEDNPTSHVVKHANLFWDGGIYSDYLLNEEKTNLHKDCDFSKIDQFKCRCGHVCNIKPRTDRKNRAKGKKGRSYQSIFDHLRDAHKPKNKPSAGIQTNLNGFVVQVPKIPEVFP